MDSLCLSTLYVTITEHALFFTFLILLLGKYSIRRKFDQHCFSLFWTNHSFRMQKNCFQPLTGVRSSTWYLEKRLLVSSSTEAMFNRIYLQFLHQILRPCEKYLLNSALPQHLYSFLWNFPVCLLIINLSWNVYRQSYSNIAYAESKLFYPMNFLSSAEGIFVRWHLSIWSDSLCYRIFFVQKRNSLSLKWELVRCIAHCIVA